jgi:hypothetical protein
MIDTGTVSSRISTTAAVVPAATVPPLKAHIHPGAGASLRGMTWRKYSSNAAWSGAALGASAAAMRPTRSTPGRTARARGGTGRADLGRRGAIWRSARSTPARTRAS